MNTRCIGFYLRGLLWLRPVPYHNDYRCWSKGSGTSGIVVLIVVPIATIFGIGFLAGRFL